MGVGVWTWCLDGEGVLFLGEFFFLSSGGDGGGVVFSQEKESFVEQLLILWLMVDSDCGAVFGLCFWWVAIRCLPQ